tara:strand:+ start:219 stop:1514 length:1296 start_codon:yes stop_codon:yes gene_type:complete
MAPAATNAAVVKQAGVTKATSEPVSSGKPDSKVVAPKSIPAPKALPAAVATVQPAAQTMTSQTSGAATGLPSGATLPSSPKPTTFRPQKRAASCSSLVDASPKAKNRTAAPRALVFSPKCQPKENNPVHLTVMLYSSSGALISKHMRSGEKALVLFVNHKGYPAVVYRMRQSLIDFLTMKNKGDAEYPATLNALQEQGILFQMNDAHPDYGEPYQTAFFLGVPTHADMETNHALGNGVAFFFEWLHYKTRQQDFGQRDTPAVVLHNLCDEPDAFFLPHLTLFKHTIDTENRMELTVASIQSSYWKIPFRLVLSLTKDRLVVGVMGPGTWNARVDLEALSFVMQAHDRVDDEPLDYDVERKCHVHPVTGNVVSEKIYKYLAEMREGLLRNVMEATCHTAMMFDVTVEEGADVSTIQGLLDEIEAKPWVVRNS